MGQKIYFVLALAFVVLLLSNIADAGNLNAQMQSLMDKHMKDSGEKSFSAEDGGKLYNIKRMHSEKKEEICPYHAAVGSLIRAKNVMPR